MITQMEADLVVEILTSYMDFAKLMEKANDSIESADTQTARSVMAETSQPVLDNIKEKRDRIYQKLGVSKEHSDD